MQGNTPPTVSEHFNAPDADVTFLSSDGVLFNLHRRNLEDHAGGFPPSDFDTQKEIVPLTEDSTTLEFLFQAVYPRPMPDVDSLAFEVLAPLSEAAEKYQLFSLMYICHSRMRTVGPDHTNEVFSYAVKHGYFDIVGQLAPLMIDRPLSEMLKILPVLHFYPWVKYVEGWGKVRDSAFRVSPNEMCHCNQNYNQRTLATILNRLLNIKSLQNLPATFSLDNLVYCSCFSNFVTRWRQRVEREVAVIPKYNDFM